MPETGDRRPEIERDTWGGGAGRGQSVEWRERRRIARGDDDNQKQRRGLVSVSGWRGYRTIRDEREGGIYTPYIYHEGIP